MLSLHGERCLEVARVGGKAAALGRALRCRLPALPGMVIPIGADAGLLAAAARDIEAGGVHAARLLVMTSSSAPSLAGLEAKVGALGDDLVVRSSSPLEVAPGYAGAFSSYVGVTPAEVATAVRGVWASALLDPGLAAGGAADAAVPHPMAVLIQPRVQPSVSGTAQVSAGEVTVVAVAGPPAPLLAGWSRGDGAVVDADGVARGPGLALAGARLLAKVAALSLAVQRELGYDLIEWAATDGRLVLLQAGRGARRPTTLHSRRDQGAVPEAAAGVARLVHMFAGRLGEDMVLPVALCGVAPDTPRPPLPAPAAAARETAAAAWVAAQALSRALRARAWGADGTTGQGASAVLAELRGGDLAAAVAQLAAAPPSPAGDLAALLADLGRVAAWLRDMEIISAVEDMWAMTPADVDHLLAAAEPARAWQRRRDTRRRALLRWEPFICAAVGATGTELSGEPASAGSGAGTSVVERGLPAGALRRPRMVLVAPRPIPQLAPLLWGAAGLVTAGGSGAAHLLEVARSRGVAAVVGCDHERLFALLGQGGTRLVAVDGDRGRVVIDAQPGA